MNETRTVQCEQAELYIYIIQYTYLLNFNNQILERLLLFYTSYRKSETISRRKPCTDHPQSRPTSLTLLG